MDTSRLAPPAAGVERHVLQAEEELRLEVNFTKSGGGGAGGAGNGGGGQPPCRITLCKGSCELQGVELAAGKPYTFTDGGGLKLALFTWHGCVLDVECSEEALESCYTSDETASNIASLNTHAQLEALRDEAAAAAAAAATATTSGGGDPITAAASAAATASSSEGPRVLICGPSESGKSSLAKLLVAYATKLGRLPIWVDLDPADNALSIPGTLAACPMDREAVQVASFATQGGIPAGTAAPLVQWHGATELVPDLFRHQVTALGRKLDTRLQQDDWARSSGLIVNTNGWIQEEGFQLLLHTVQALRINVVLVMGHDRLYSMFKSKLLGNKTSGTSTSASGGSSADPAKNAIKVIKLPRSGGVVSRSKDFIRQHRSRSVKRYFYGESVQQIASSSSAAAVGAAPNTGASASSPNNNSSSSNVSIKVMPQLTPFLAQVPFASVKLFKLVVMSLSASLLPVTASQATEPVQLQAVPISERLNHAVVAVCHPAAVQAYEAGVTAATTGSTASAKDLYEAGVAGFCVVERVLMETEMLHLLSPCAGSLPSHTLLVGDLTWME